MWVGCTEGEVYEEKYSTSTTSTEGECSMKGGFHKCGISGP